MASRIPYDPPVRGGIFCTNCNVEIQAVARLTFPLEIVGLNGYEWTHVGSGPDCRPLIRHAQPYDGWRATKLVEAELGRRRDDALDGAP